jgi:integrase
MHTRKTMKTIERRGNTYSVRFRDGGKDRRIALRTSDEAVALERADDAARIGSLPTLADAIREYRARPEGLGKTEEIYLARLERVLGGELLVKLGPHLIEERYTKPRLEIVKPGTVRRELAVLKAVLNRAHAFEMVKTEPKVRRPSVHDERVRHAARDERDRMIELAQGAEFRAVVAFLFYTGARLGEALGARPSDVARGAVTFASRKGRGSVLRRRSVPIHPVLAGLLVPNEEWVLPSPSGQQWSRTELRRRWADLCDVARMEDFRIHDCRHTFASLMVMAGVDLITVAALTGHSSMQMLRRYSHMNSSHLVGAMGAL